MKSLRPAFRDLITASTIVLFWLFGSLKRSFKIFLKKKEENAAFVRDNIDETIRRQPKTPSEASKVQLSRRVPWSPELLRQTSALGFEFSLEQIQRIVEDEEKRLLAEKGNLPLKPSLLAIWPRAKELFQPVLKTVR